MASRRTCFMHVGTGKTGSSAVQYALARTRDDLERHSYQFPSFGRPLRRMQNGQATGGNARPVRDALRQRDVKAAIDLVRPLAEKPDHIVLSNEGLYRVDPPVLKEFCAALQSINYVPKLLVFFRPQVEQTVSAFLQHAKSNTPGLPTDVNEYATSQDYNRKRNWHLTAQHLETAFGRENITVEWYPAVIRRSGILKALFDWLGVPAPELALPNINPTPGLESLRVIQFFTEHGLGRRKLFDRFLSVAKEKGLLGAKIALETEAAMAVYNATRASNEMLLREYCRDLSPDDELKPPAPYAQPPADELVVRQLIEIAGRMLIEHGEDRALVETAMEHARSSRQLGGR